MLIMEPLAQAIMNHPKILGIKIGHTDNKIGLNADDVIISLSNPISSLPLVSNLLQNFSTLSLYKVNTSKSQMLPIYLPKKIQTHLSAPSSFSWALKSGIQYLGIQLTSPSSTLFSMNYETLLRTIQRQKQELSKSQISWAGRAALGKMIILPTILYHFRTLPIPLSGSYLQKLQATLNNFILGKKRARF